MYLMVRLEESTDNEGRLLLGLEDMISQLRSQGWEVLHTNRQGWNILVYGVKNKDDVSAVWQFAETFGAFGYVPPEL